MYLAEKIIDGEVHYLIRESVPAGSGFTSRDLFDLGTDPGRYVCYPGGNAYYIADEVCDTLYDLGVKESGEELEEIFLPFMAPRIRYVVDSARERAHGRQKRTPLGPERKGHIQAQVRTFDKRRALYLRNGEVDQGRIGRIPVHLYKWVCGKSRDEIEQIFIQMEQRLAPEERKVYIFVVFDLQRFFTESWARKMPQGLNEAKMDTCFLEELCRLNGDASFWGDHRPPSSLNEYLIRYAIMFFDHDFGPDSFWGDYVRQFMDARRKHRPPPMRRTVSVEEASRIFGVKSDALNTMTKRGLDRLYRQVAKRLHPDTGGTHDAFVRLTEVYEELRARKGAPPRWRRK